MYTYIWVYVFTRLGTYADDVLLFGKTAKENQVITKIFVKEFAKVGQDLDANKSKILTYELLDFDF